MVRSFKSVRLSLLFVLLVSIDTVAVGQTSVSNDVRRVFAAIPDSIFNVACCDGDVEQFLKKFVKVEDARNGFLQAADTEEDPQYGSFTMKLFPKPDGSYLVGFHSEAMRWSDFYFLEYRDGKVRNISRTIPAYSQSNYYEFPRVGTTIKVYRKKFDLPGEPLGADNTVTKGAKLYDLVWANGRLTVKR